MNNTVLTAKKREEQGRSASRRLRHMGRVPAIVYGLNNEPIAISLDHNTIYYALKKEDFHTTILKIDIEGRVESVLLRDFQMHPFKQIVMHLDFQRINENEETQIRVPLHFINEATAYAVKSQGAHITRVVTDVEIRALAKDIPHYIEVDLKDIRAGQTIHLSDLRLPADVTLVDLTREDDLAVVIAAGINEEEISDEIISPSDVPTTSSKDKE